MGQKTTTEKEMENSKDVETFAFLDLETSTIPDYNCGRTSITEMSIIACSNDNMKKCNENNSDIPRCINKLSLCFNPAARIAPDSTRLSGLDNYMLENEKKFDKNAANIIKCFLNQLQDPVCLVAHNGDKFDFPILRKHFEKNEIDLPNVLCIDSLLACKKIDKLLNACVRNQQNEILFQSQTQMQSQKVENDTEFQKHLFKEYIEAITKESDNQTQIREGDNINGEQGIKIEEEIYWQKRNETTPKRLTQRNNPLKRSRIFDQNTSPDSPRKVFKSRKELFPEGTNNTGSPSPSRAPVTPNNKMNSYSLSAIYERQFGKAIDNPHRAEADVLALLKIAINYGEEFLKYVNCNARRFSD